MSLDEDRFFSACADAELKSGERRALELDGQPVLLVKLGTRLYAMRNRCTHLDFALDNGRLIGTEIICRRHGARFSLQDGRALGGPAVRRLDIYETRVVDGMIEILVPPAKDNAGWPY
jgi:3-phenylpropionate/trans-cinnamate dioxygenase ferredoxin subunit